MSDSSMLPPPGKASGQMRRGQPGQKPKDFKGTVKRLWTITRGHRRGLGLVMALSALSCVSTMVSPLVIGQAVTAIDGGNPVTLALLCLLAVYVGDYLVRFLQQYMMAGIGQNIIRHIRVQLFEAMKHLPLAYFDRHQHGELMSRLTNDVDNISSTISSSLTELLTFAFTILGILVAMLSLSPTLTVISLAGAMLVLLLTKVVTGRTRKLFAQQQRILGQLNGQIEESVSGIAVVKAFGQEARMERQFDQLNRELCQVSTRALVWSGFLMPLTNVINNLSYVALCVFSGALALRGNIPVGMITSFLLYSRQFSRPFVDIASIYNSLQTAVAGAERVFEVFDQPGEPPDADDALPMDAPLGDVQLDHVTFGYDPRRPILKDICLTVPHGTRAAIVGPTGAGKTTIMNLLTRFYDVDGGRILLDGHDLRQYKMRDLRRAFSVVLQDTSLFALSVKDNISYGREGVPFERIVSAAQVAGAHGFISRLPQGYDTVLTQGGMELSQGERQLITIARAVLEDAPILILDEATSSVDTVTEQKIRSAMIALTGGRTSFIIAHRLCTVRDSDIIILIDDGRIKEQGTHAQLMALNGDYAAVYRTQTGMGQP